MHLGLPASLVPDIAAELLRLGLVTQRADLSVAITEKGRQALASNGSSMTPQNRHPRLPYDPLTRRIIEVDVDDTLERAHVRRHGLYVAPTKPRRPTVGRIRLDEVRRYCKTYDRLPSGAEVLDVADIKEVRLKYREGILLFRLVSDVAGRPKYAAYRDTEYLEDESAALERLAEGGCNLVPEDVRHSDPIEIFGRTTSVSKEEVDLLAGIESAERGVGNDGDSRDRGRAEALREALRERTGGRMRLLKTEEHRGVLLKAIQEAKSQLTLVSAWIRPRAFDDEVSTLLRDAILRGVSVRIAWGLGETKGREKERNTSAGRDALRQLRSGIPKRYQQQLVENHTETHEKYIICDGDFCAFGSFNWLSYRGEVDEGYRREVSCYTEREEIVRMFLELSEDLFGPTGR